VLSQSWLKLFAASLALLLCIAAVQAWRADQRDRAQLAAELASAKQLLAAADSRQHDRDAQLAQTLAALASEKRTIITPAQILRELPSVIPLPAPITLQTPSTPSPSSTRPSADSQASAAPQTSANLPAAPQPNAFIPSADLKPLYDFALECKACQAKLSAAQNDLADERQKTAALTKERDDAVRIAKGGSAWRRVARAAKWFIIGAAAGAIAVKATH
jgi:hypothetical protein